MLSLNKSIVKNFWNMAFKTRLYDLLVMSSYDDSLKQIVKAAEIKEGYYIIDVGCGSARLLQHLHTPLVDTNSKWFGFELTTAGVKAARDRIQRLRLDKYAQVLPANMCDPLPLPENSIDVAIAHFSLYVIQDRADRVIALKNIAATVKKNGRILVAVPGENYNAADQVRSSLKADKENRKISFLNRIVNLLAFHTVGRLSESVIADHIRNGVWQGFSERELEMEANEADLKMEWMKYVYGQTSLMAAFSKV